MMQTLPAVPGMASAAPELQRALGALDCVEPGLAEPLCAVISLFTDGSFDPQFGVERWHPVTSPAMGLLRWYEGTASHAGIPKGHVPRYARWVRLWPYTGARLWSVALMSGPRQIGYALRLFDRMGALKLRDPHKLAMVALGAMPTLHHRWVLGRAMQSDDTAHLPCSWDQDGDGAITIEDLDRRLGAIARYARALPRIAIPDLRAAA